VSISIKNKEADRLLEAIKAATGKDACQVVLELLRREHARLAAVREVKIEDALAATRRLQEAWAGATVVDPRTPQELLDYDEDGLPR
jgi:hypothetical protein